MSTKPKILYVDDEPINLQIFNLNLRDKYAICTASSGKKAMQILEDNTDIGIVVSDMKMPIMNGIEFIKIAKQKFPHIKFYILTGFEISDEIQGALTSGLIMKYFRKPFNMDEMEYYLTSTP